MNRHERRRRQALLREGEKWGTTGEPPEGYARTAEATLNVIRGWLAANVERHPEFAMLPKDMAFAVSLADAGHRFARNDAAHELIDLLSRMKADFGLADHPTYMMLRVALDMVGVQYQIVGLSDLGFAVQGSGGA